MFATVGTMTNMDPISVFQSSFSMGLRGERFMVCKLVLPEGFEPFRM
jgi:hypothetical protein